MSEDVDVELPDGEDEDSGGDPMDDDATVSDDEDAAVGP